MIVNFKPQFFHNKQQYFQNKFFHLHLCYFKKISAKTEPNKYKAAYFNLKYCNLF